MGKRGRYDLFDELPPIARIIYNIFSFTYDGLSFCGRLLFKSREKSSSYDRIVKSDTLAPTNANVTNYRSDLAPEVKGSGFENFVLDRFDEKYFSIVEMTHKFAGQGDRYIESDLNPDFTFRYKPTDSTFAVEAKFRSHLNKDGMLEWSNHDQLVR